MSNRNRERRCNVVSVSVGSRKTIWFRHLATTIMQSIILSLIPFSIAHALMGGEGLMWSVLQNEPVQLTVCWENPDAAEPFVGEGDQTSGWQRREWVRLALKGSWEREARISFVGWEECKDENVATPPPHTLGPRRPGTADENIKITITTGGGGQNPGHGSWGDYQQSGVTLDLHCGNKACIVYLAIHEFGHVLGLYHGEERSDWPSRYIWCPKQDWPPSDPWWPVPTEKQWGFPDPKSIMAYCSGSPVALSSIDVAGVQRAYERHIPGTLLSLPGSLCLSAHASAGNGDAAFGWACNEALDDQEWHYDPSKSSLYIHSPADPTHARHCLDVDTTNYSDVQIWECLDGANQQWQFQQIMVRGYGGLCLSRQAGGEGELSMQSCDGSADQLWRVEKSDTDGFIRLQTNTGNQCLSLGGTSGSIAKLEPCSPTKIFAPIAVRSRNITKDTVVIVNLPGSQANGVLDFYLATGGQILAPQSGSSNLCLDVRDVWDSDFVNGSGGPATGQVVQFFNCYSTQLNQKWSFSGHLVSENKCLALSSSAVNNGAEAVVTDCTTANQQKWDYYW